MARRCNLLHRSFAFKTASMACTYKSYLGDHGDLCRPCEALSRSAFEFIATGSVQPQNLFIRTAVECKCLPLGDVLDCTAERGQNFRATSLIRVSRDGTCTARGNLYVRGTSSLASIVRIKEVLSSTNRKTENESIGQVWWHRRGRTEGCNPVSFAVHRRRSLNTLRTFQPVHDSFG